jgi:hypothetical protein
VEGAAAATVAEGGVASNGTTSRRPSAALDHHSGRWAGPGRDLELGAGAFWLRSPYETAARATQTTAEGARPAVLTEISLCSVCAWHEIFEGAPTSASQRGAALRPAGAGRVHGAAADRPPPLGALAAVRHSCACIVSPCLRHCGHGASIGAHHSQSQILAIDQRLLSAVSIYPRRLT